MVHDEVTTLSIRALISLESGVDWCKYGDLLEVYCYIGQVIRIYETEVLK